MHDELDELIRAAAPARPLTTADCVSVARAVRAEDRTRRRRRSMVVGLAALIVTPAVAVGGLRMMAHTGEQVPVLPRIEGLPDHGTSEAINVCAPDGPAVVAEYVPTDRPLPQGVTWTDIRRVALREFRVSCAQGPYPQDEASLRAHFAFAAFDAWSVAYVRASDRGDATATATAATHLREAAGLPAVAAVIGDDAPDNWYVRIADAATRGQVDVVREAATNALAQWPHLRGIR